MRKIIIILFSVGFFCNAYAQNVPYFEMPIYFEDGIGNKDTIVVGYDALAQNCNSIVATAPMDSIFEVRAMNAAIQQNEISYRRYIFDTEPTTVDGTNVIYGAQFRIAINIQHLPLKISWDKSYLQDFWRHSTFLSPDSGTHTAPDFWYTERITCIAEQSSLADDLSYRVGAFPGEWVTAELPVEGRGIVELPAYHLVFTWGNFCQQAINTVTGAGVQSIAVSPNPAQDLVRLGLPTDKTYESLRIYTPEGKEVLSVQKPTVFDISVGSLPKGVYFVQVISADKQQWVGKLLKF